MLKCAHCDKVYKYGSEKERHEKSHFPQFECKICSKKFSFLSALRRHQKQHERSGSVQCLECGGYFRDDTLLKRHVQYAHKGTFCCSECNTAFSSELALSTHCRSHKPESERRYRCSHDRCSKTFNFPHHLKHHELTHTNTKQHYCTVCGKGFIQSHHLKAHLKSHSPKNWWFCTALHCKKKFATQFAWKKHIGTHMKLLETNLREIKIDSGISSDSNTASEIEVTKSIIEDDVLCTTCGTLILRRQYAQHRLYCTPSFKEHFNNKDLGKVLSDCNTDMKSSDSFSRSPRLEPDNDNGHVPSESNASEMYSQPPDGTHTDASTRAPSSIAFDTNNNSNATNACEGCSYTHKMYGTGAANNTFPLTSQNKDMPEIEYRKDGIIKIRETFDVDIVTIEKAKRKIKNVVESEVNDLKYVPFNSCKAVLGNCIASEDGSIGEGCLCVRMNADDQQMSAQEIYELTPHPSWTS